MEYIFKIHDDIKFGMSVGYVKPKDDTGNKPLTGAAASCINPVITSMPIIGSATGEEV